jgi:hypothetical protein
MENKSSLTFTFQGDHEVDAVSIVTAMHGLIKISNEIAKQNYPDVEFRLAVRALVPGSLSFDFVALACSAQNLFTQDNIEYAKNLIDCIKTSFEIKSFLKGSPPRSKKEQGNFITIENKNGSKMTIPVSAGVYFIDSTIDQSITGIFAESSGRQGISGIRLEHRESVVDIPAKEFTTLSEKIDVSQIEVSEFPESRKVTVTRQNEILYIRKPDLLSKTKWEFKSDKYITADVEDKTFLDSVQSGKQSIVARMYIIADVRLVMEMGTDGLPDENTCKYTVVKVHSVHVPGDGQLCLTE